jgi:hypothetical protein
MRPTTAGTARPTRGRPRAHAARTAPRSERGDVPGWVLITLMTAALVSALWLVAEDQLVALFQSAMDTVRR